MKSYIDQPYYSSNWLLISENVTVNLIQEVDLELLTYSWITLDIMKEQGQVLKIVSLLNNTRKRYHPINVK